MAQKGGVARRAGTPPTVMQRSAGPKSAAQPKGAGKQQQRAEATRPAVSAGGVPPEKSRTPLSNQRFKGSIQEWHNTWGWITPLRRINHALSAKNDGMVYLHRGDVRGNSVLKAGFKVEFSLYHDSRGLGASDCLVVPQSGLEEEEEEQGEGAERGHGEHPAGTEEHATESFEMDQADDSSEPPLPEGWEKVWNDEHGQFYYWHKPSKTSTWTRPDEPVEEPPEEEPAMEYFDTGAVDSYVPVQGSTKRKASEALESGPVRRTDGRVRGEVTKWHGFFGWLKPVGDLSAELQQTLKQAHGKVYANAREVRDGLKLEPGMQVDFLPKVDENGLVALAIGPPMDPLPQETPDFDGTAPDGDGAQGQFEEPQEVSGEPALEESELLPGWEQVWSEEHQSHYYWHTASKQASWDRPTLGPGLGKGQQAAANDAARKSTASKTTAKGASTGGAKGASEGVGSSSANSKGKSKGTVKDVEEQASKGTVKGTAKAAANVSKGSAATGALPKTSVAHGAKSAKGETSGKATQQPVSSKSAVPARNVKGGGAVDGVKGKGKGALGKSVAVRPPAAAQWQSANMDTEDQLGDTEDMEHLAEQNDHSFEDAETYQEEPMEETEQLAEPTEARVRQTVRPGKGVMGVSARPASGAAGAPRPQLRSAIPAWAPQGQTKRPRQF